jgi:hypothetical protein
VSNKKVNSAEQQAEEILKDAYAEVRAEECPQGADCPVHFRVDEAYVDQEGGYARFVTYIGEFVVITDDNRELIDPVALFRMIFRGYTPKPFETSVLYVGDGAIGDVPEWTMEALGALTRYRETHDSWEGLQDRHELVVGAVREGAIDLSERKG